MIFIIWYLFGLIGSYLFVRSELEQGKDMELWEIFPFLFCSLFGPINFVVMLIKGNYLNLVIIKGKKK